MLSYGALILSVACLLHLGRCRRLQTLEDISQREPSSTASEQQVNQLCPDQVINATYNIFGAAGGHEPKLTVAQLAELVAASRQDVELLLGTVFDDRISFSAPLSVYDLCSRAVLSIPKILGVRAPSAPWLACPDDDCRIGQVNISPEQLARSELISPSPDVAEEEDGEAIESHALNAEPTSPENLVQDLLRVVLAVVFGIFPESKQIEPRGDPARTLLNQFLLDPKSSDVESTQQSASDRHEYYRIYTLKASGWIAAAIRRIGSGRRLVRKWFNLQKESAIDEQLSLILKHLRLMLASTSRLVIMKGVPWKHGGQCKGSIVAYVRQFAPWPNVADFREIGEKKDGRYVIHICDYYWNSGLSEAARVGTIVHESSHHFGTVDKGYCDKINCLKLPPEDARNNADSYLHFIKELVQSAAEDVPDQACNTICGATSFEGGKMGLWKLSTVLPGRTCGDCVEKGHVAFGGVKLWGEDCVENELEASRRLSHKLCCKVYSCTSPS